MIGLGVRVRFWMSTIKSENRVAERTQLSGILGAAGDLLLGARGQAGQQPSRLS